MAWWRAQTQFYGVEYKLNPGDNPKGKAINEFRMSMAVMNPFKPTKKIETVEARLQYELAQWITPSRMLASSPAPQNSGFQPPGGALIKRESNCDELRPNTDGLQDGIRYVIPAKRDLKRKDPPQSSDEELLGGPAPKVRRVEGVLSSSQQETAVIPRSVVATESGRLWVSSLPSVMTEVEVRRIFSFYHV